MRDRNDEVLGFYENETAAYVFRENTILTFLGALAGLVLGVFLHRFVHESDRRGYGSL